MKVEAKKTLTVFLIITILFFICWGISFALCGTLMNFTGEMSESAVVNNFSAFLISHLTQIGNSFKSVANLNWRGFVLIAFDVVILIEIILGIVSSVKAKRKAFIPFLISHLFVAFAVNDIIACSDHFQFVNNGETFEMLGYIPAMQCRVGVLSTNGMMIQFLSILFLFIFALFFFIMTSLTYIFGFAYMKQYIREELPEEEIPAIPSFEKEEGTSSSVNDTAAPSQTPVSEPAPQKSSTILPPPPIMTSNNQGLPHDIELDNKMTNIQFSLANDLSFLLNQLTDEEKNQLLNNPSNPYVTPSTNDNLSKEEMVKLIKEVVHDTVKAEMEQMNKNVPCSPSGTPFMVQYFNGNGPISQGPVEVPNAQEAKKVVPEVKKPEVKPAVIVPAPAPAPKEDDNNAFERISFAERLLKSEKDLHANYNEIKNEILSWGVKSRVSFFGDTFRLHTKTYIKIVVAGKALKLYFALNPKDYKDTTIPFQDVGKKGLYVDIPFAFKVKSGLSMKRCKDLIRDCMTKDGLTQGEVGKTNWVKDLKQSESKK